MVWLTVGDFLRMIGLTPLNPAELHQISQRYALDSSVRTMAELHEMTRECGDEASNEAFYRFFYTECVPELGIPWYEAFERAYNLPLEWAVLPAMARFCSAPERRTHILDVGCGVGLPLCYLAAQFPDMRFVGVDCRPEALVHARRRVEKLGLTNVTFLEGDAFRGGIRWQDTFDGAILRNVVDDAREAWTDFLDAKFSADAKLAALRSALVDRARVWVSLTPYPHLTPEFEQRLCAAFEVGGYVTPPPERVDYDVTGHRCTHLVWTLCPKAVAAVID